MKNSKTSFREVFLAVLGITPQVLTECLYYYYSDYYKIKRYFDQIIVFTTSEGSKQLIKSLFVDKKLSELEKALDLEAGQIPFSENDIRIFKRLDGSFIHDMVTSKDNEDALSLLFDSVEEITSDPETKLTATVAGGRKTMSTFPALSFQIYGREQDELIHILAPDDKMRTDWFFPTNPGDKNEKLIVSHIPILKVGRYITRSLNIKPEKLIDKLQDELVSKTKIKKLTVEKNQFYGDDERFSLPAKLASYLRYLIKRRINSNCKSNCEGCKKCFVSSFDLIDLAKTDVLVEHEVISGKWGGNLHRTKAGRVDSLSIAETVSRIGSQIKKAKISYPFKNYISIKKMNLDPKNKKYISFGVRVNKNHTSFKD